MKGWYKAAVNHAPSPAQVTLDWITEERLDLYCHVQPTWKNIPISAKPFQVKDKVPMEDKIEWVLQRLRKNHSGGTLGIQVEHLKGWIEGARKVGAAAEKTAEEAEEATVGLGEEGEEVERETYTKKELMNWEKVVSL